jgi:hypothetical protein
MANNPTKIAIIVIRCSGVACKKSKPMVSSPFLLLFETTPWFNSYFILYPLFLVYIFCDKTDYIFRGWALSVMGNGFPICPYMRIGICHTYVNSVLNFCTDISNRYTIFCGEYL